ncbi:MAG TPA: hypothetical protein VGX92_07035 [Pyrinomonadaceae bacterium]|jgi:hypothetical protein|nr:hypothetical protein [Pyrinomonadaceae bacterium]
MAVERESRRKHNPVKTSSREAAERAAQLAPLEERGNGGGGGASRSATGRDGALVVDTGALKLPEGLMEEADAPTQSLFHLEPVVLVILVFALAFIAFITYLIATEPAK